MASNPTRLEDSLIHLDELPWGALYRMAVGFSILPAFALAFGRNASGVALAAFFLAVLFLLRLVPGVVRRLLRFSQVAQSTWQTRRQMAKRYDSYQWQKLFWIGLGLAASMAVSGDLRTSRVMLTSICLSAGAAGLVFWRAKHARSQVA
jgi:hypothetical protein